MAVGMISGAILFHQIGPIGNDPCGDGGALFQEATFTLAMAPAPVVRHRDEALAFAARRRA